MGVREAEADADPQPLTDVAGTENRAGHVVVVVQLVYASTSQSEWP